MWECKVCNITLANPLFPVHCLCGTVYHQNGETNIRNPYESAPPVDTSALWKELHEYVYINSELAEIFLKEWTAKVPSYDCDCSSHWAAILKKLPPNFSSACEFFRWTIDAHNLVNKRLGKPVFTYEQAKTLYNKDCVL